MAKTATITLAGVDYTVHAFNIGELEELADIIEGPPKKAAFQILRLAMKRAIPPVTDVNAIEAERDEISAAMEVITKLAGLADKTANPPEEAKAEA